METAFALDSLAPDIISEDMSTFISEAGQVTVPAWVTDIDSFRRWTDTDDFPREGRIWWLRGEVWADMSKEQIFTHLAVKNEMYLVTLRRD